jgi:hypothetical protein
MKIDHADPFRRQSSLDVPY